MEDNKKDIIAHMICEALKNDEIKKEDILNKIEVPKESTNGDFAYPCFNLAKVLRKSPVQIANELKELVVLDDNFSKVEAVNGFLNFYVNVQNLSKEVLTKIISKKDEYGKSDEGNGKTIVIDYSSPNIAKPFHLGHFRNTVLGSALYNLYENLGYKVVGINHLGDWGRQFGLLTEGYDLFKDEYDIKKDPLGTLSDIYVRINKLAKEDENVMNIARENFKKLEEGDKRLLEMWEYFRNVSLEEYKRIYKILGSKFDSYNGEAFYSDKMDEIIDILNKKNVLKESEGAKVIDVGDDMPPCIIVKSDGTTIYATRDLAAILYRARTYDFDKAIYITASEQKLHFKQVFEVAKYIVDEKYQKGLVHVSYGMIRLKTGKMSTREGNVIYIDELINEAIAKSKDIIKEKNTNIDDVDKLAKQIGVGALTFNYLKSNKNKDIIFDLDDTLRFDGETGPYIQYTYVRTKAILEKTGFNVESKIDYDVLTKKEETNLIKELQNYESILNKAAKEYEPAILSRYLIDVATAFSKFYNECSVLGAESDELKNARCALTYATSVVLKNGLKILGIECPDKM